MLKRKSIIVYFKSPKALKHIEKIGPISYFTKKKKYAIIYVSEDQLEDAFKALKEIKLVKKVEESMLDSEGYEMEL